MDTGRTQLGASSLFMASPCPPLLNQKCFFFKGSKFILSMVMVIESSDGVRCLTVWGLKMEEALGRPLVIMGIRHCLF